MGIDADTRADPKLDCKPDDLLKFNGSFASGDPLEKEFRDEGLRPVGFGDRGLGIRV